MIKLQLPKVDLIGIDTNHPEQGLQSMQISMSQIDFGKAIMFTCADKSDFDSSLTNGIEFIKIDKIKEYLDYSDFCLRLGDYLHNDYVLTTHGDGFVINANLWTDDFFKFDYIGAPWAECHMKAWGGLPNPVGNGGFSLRSKKMLDFSKQFKTTGGNNEDGFLTNFKIVEAKEYGIKYADLGTAYKFSVHHLEDVGGVFEPEKYFGFHGYHNLPIALEYVNAKGK